MVVFIRQKIWKHPISCEIDYGCPLFYIRCVTPKCQIICYHHFSVRIVSGDVFTYLIWWTKSIKTYQRLDEAMTNSFCRISERKQRWIEYFCQTTGAPNQKDRFRTSSNQNSSWLKVTSLPLSQPGQIQIFREYSHILIFYAE